MEEPKKRRGRKPLSLKKALDKDIIQSHVDELKEHQECLIVNIPYTDDIMCDTLVSPESNIDLSQENKDLKNQVQNLRDQIKLLENRVPSSQVNKVHQTFTCELPTKRIDQLNNHEKINCWWCCNVFETIPIQLPHAYIEGCFHVTGNFCSFNCCLSYNYSLRDLQHVNRTSLINLMYKVICGSDRRLIPAPPKELLVSFGGFLTIDQFRQDSISIGLERRVHLPPIKSILHVIDEDNRNFLKGESRQNLYIPLNKSEVSKAKADLKLKRTNPIKSKHIRFEDSLGLIKKSANSDLDS